MANKHRSFNADRFLDKFHGQEQILRGFVAIWREGLPSLNVDTLTVDRFKQWLAEGSDPGKDDLLEALYQVYDLCTEVGEANLRASCEQWGYDPDPNNTLPFECLVLLVRTGKKSIFLDVYDRYRFSNAERFSLFQGESAKPITNLKRTTKALQRRLAREFKKSKNSERVLVRSYEEAGKVNFVIYHEKRTHATLVIKGTANKQLRVRPHIFRPAQQDFVSYDPESGRIEIEAGVASEETKLRDCFAEVCFNDIAFFAGPRSDDRINLQTLTRPGFALTCPQGVTAILTSASYSLPQVEDPAFTVRSKDVLATIQRNVPNHEFSRADLSKAIFKIFFQGDRRGKRVELTGTKSIKFNRATHAEEVYSLLTEWGILRRVEEDADDGEDLVEPGYEPSGQFGHADTLAV